MNDPSPLLQEKKSRILAAAKARFLYYGVSKTTMRDIADDMNIAVSNLYLYFENKREIVLAIAEECRAEQDQVAVQVLSDPSLTPAQKLERVLVEKFRTVRAFRNDSPKGAELMAYLIQEFPERPASWQQDLETKICAALEDGCRQGYFRIASPRQSAAMIRIALGQFFLPPHVELPLNPKEEELVSLLRWLISLIESQEGAMNS